MTQFFAAFEDLFKSVYEFFASIIGAFAHAIQAVISTILNFFSGIVNLFTDVFKGVIDVVGGVGSFVLSESTTNVCLRTIKHTTADLGPKATSSSSASSLPAMSSTLASSKESLSSQPRKPTEYCLCRHAAETSWAGKWRMPYRVVLGGLVSGATGADI